jgi:hypothetical protein
MGYMVISSKKITCLYKKHWVARCKVHIDLASVVFSTQVGHVQANPGKRGENVLISKFERSFSSLYTHSWM